MSSKKKAEAVKRQEDTALARALIWFAVAMAMEFLILLVDNIFTKGIPSWNFANALAKGLPIVAVAFLVCAVVAGIRCRKSTAAKEELAFLPLVLCVVFAVLSGSALLLCLFSSAASLLKVIIPALGVLALVYYLYQKEFFLSAIASGIGLLGLWLVRRGSARFNLVLDVYAVVGIVVLVIGLVLVLKMKKHHGVLTMKGKQVAVLTKKANYLPIVLSCVFGILVQAACLLASGTVAFYLMFALLAWLLVLLVYYTVKLM